MLGFVKFDFEGVVGVYPWRFESSLPHQYNFILTVQSHQSLDGIF